MSPAKNKILKRRGRENTRGDAQRKLRQLRLDVAAGQTFFLQILLVVVLGFVESHGRNNLCGNGLRETVRLFQRLF